MQPDFDRFFVRYADAYNRSLEGEVQDASIRSAFAEEFIAAGPQGTSCGRNDDSFSATLREAYAFYRAIGTKRMSMRRLHTTPIDDLHYMVRVYWRAEYQRKDGKPVTIDFDVAYMLSANAGDPKIFAFVAGDEMALYRQHGLV